ncbi:MAG TPA: hypothetical protein VHG69_03765 [Thermoleophilaceae bacterium]|nr:hypothetical protein [Thermoleophilaceae bacterium]
MPKLTYANVTSTLALFLALGGVSWAAITVGTGQIRNNSVRTQDLRNNNIRSKDIRNRTIVNRDVLTNTLSGLQINENTLGRVPDAARLQGRDPSSFTVSCATGTSSHAGGCIENSARSAQTFAAASRTCGVANRRLPLVTELESFRQQPGITLAGAELTANLDGADHVVTITDSGTRAAPPDTAPGQFRCVAPLTN